MDGKVKLIPTEVIVLPHWGKYPLPWTYELGFALLSPEKQIKIRKSGGDLRMKFIVLYSHEITISEKYKKMNFGAFNI